jgi:predicted glycogen debranching enzyme
MKTNADFSADELVIVARRGKSREYFYTNKIAAHFSGESGDRSSRSYHGMCVNTYKVLEDWRFQLDGVQVNRNKAVQVLFYPHRLVRIFEHPPIREQICLLDKHDILLVELVTGKQSEGILWPLVDIRPVRQVKKPVYRVIWRSRDNLLLILGERWGRGSSGNPVWLGVTSNVPMKFLPEYKYFSTIYTRGQRRGVMGSGTPFQPGVLRFRPKRGKARFFFVAGRTQQEVIISARHVSACGTELIRQKRKRLERSLSCCSVRCDDIGLNSALAWARVSMDALIMNQKGPGIYAGLPWFANYWGRDTCISLPGAALVNGQFALAKKILVALASYQDRMAGSETFGRIPNLLEPGKKLYNTADGTLWFVRQIEEYARYSGDVRTVQSLFPAVKRAIQGEIYHRTDESGLVVHGAAETWMDAGGDDKPLSPRDNRAVEIQVLWQTALLSGARMALLAGQKFLSAEWTDLAGRVNEVFLRKFWDSAGQGLYDHLNPDDTPDTQFRPNQILALTVPFHTLLSRDQERVVMDQMMRKLVYSHGVGSLVPEDPQFRPRHLGHDQYHFDEAYHNGDVWLWLAGPLITALISHGRKETAYAVTQVLTDQILNRGAVGTLGELFNAAPTEENDNEAGTFTQAWSLAEYIRVVFQDYLGIRPDALKKEVVIEPAVPVQWGNVDFQFALSRALIKAKYLFSGDEQTYVFLPKELPQPFRLHLRIRLPGNKLLSIIRSLRDGQVEEIRVLPHNGTWRVLANGKTVRCHFQRTDFDVDQGDKIAFRQSPATG